MCIYLKKDILLKKTLQIYAYCTLNRKQQQQNEVSYQGSMNINEKVTVYTRIQVFDKSICGLNFQILERNPEI